MSDSPSSALTDEQTRQYESARLAHPLAASLRFPYALVIFMLALLTLVLWNVGWSFDRVNMAMLYLLPVLFSAVRFGRGPAYLAAGLGVLLFDFFFVPPLLSFSVSDLRYLISFAVFLLVAGLTATQAARLRQQLQDAHAREARTASLYAISQQIVAVSDLGAVLGVIVQQLAVILNRSTATLLPDASDKLVISHQSDASWRAGSDMRCADAVFASGQPAFVAERSMQGESLYLPLKTDARIYGVLCVRADGRSERIEPDEMAFIEAVAGLAAVSVARAKLEEEARIAQLSAASERLRTSLLDSISHELRTPLAAIIGSATGMLESGDLLNGDDQQNLLSTIREGAFRMDRLVCNLLGIVRLESGMLQLRRQWCDMTDVVGVTLRHLAESLQSRVVKVDIPDDLPAVYVDDVLLEQVLVNVLSNAIKYSEEDSDIVVSVRMHGDVLEIVVRDRGVGIDVKEEARIFDKFYRGARTSHIPGTGLGLAICKGIAQAHGGDIKARAVDGDGLEMVVTLPAGSCTTDEGYVQEG